MTYIPNISNITSQNGVNSDTSISGGNWVSNTYTGVAELNELPYVGSNLQVDESGTLYFQFSQDATNWSSYPVNGFTVVSGINEVHTAYKGGRYVRVVFVGSGGRSYFRLKTFFSNTSLPLSAPLNQSITSDQDASVVRAVNIGENPTGSYINQRVDGIDFKTETPLTANSVYTSTLVNTEGYSQLETHIYSDVKGTLTAKWYNDASKTTLLRVVNRPYEGTEIGKLSYISSPILAPYVEYVYTNGTTNQTMFYLSLQSRTKSVNGHVLGIKDFIPNTIVTNMNRSIIVGETLGGKFLNVPVDDRGHLEVALHSPLLPFGSIHTENLTPVFQTDAVYGINVGQNVTHTTLSGTVTSSNSLFNVSTGTTQYATASLQSRRRLRYRPGQGIVGRFTAKFTSPIPYSYQVAGFGHAEDGVYFGYKDVAGITPEFGILYVKAGVREIQTLTITTPQTTGGTVTVTLADVAHVVTVSNNNNIQRTVYEISRFTYTGWEAQAYGNTVVFLAGSAGNKTGTFSLSGGTAVGTFAETKTGSSGTETFIPQSQWNGDKLDGTGYTGVVLDPTKGNVYQMNIQYLGFGAIEFKVEVPSLNNNNSTMVTVHTMNNPNTLMTPTFTNPSFPFTMAVYSAGSTTNLTVECASYAGFVEGSIETRGNRFVYEGQLAGGVTTGVYHALGTIMNKLVYNGKSSQIVINLKVFAGHIEDANTGASLYLIRNGDLVGNPNFVDYSTTSATSYDTSETSVTISNKDKIVAILPLGINESSNHDFINDSITLQPGEWLTLAAKADTTTLDYCTITLTTREDQ